MTIDDFYCPGYLNIADGQYFNINQQIEYLLIRQKNMTSSSESLGIQNLLKMVIEKNRQKQTQYDQLVLRLSNVQSTNKQLLTQNNRLSSQLQAMKIKLQKLEGVNDKCQKLQKDNFNLKHKIKSMQEDISLKDISFSSMKQKAKSLQNKIKILTKCQKRLQASKKRLQDSLVVTQNQNRKLRNQIYDLKEKFTSNKEGQIWSYSEQLF